MAERDPWCRLPQTAARAGAVTEMLGMREALDARDADESQGDRVPGLTFTLRQSRIPSTKKGGD
jgi:hypothetical protein